MRRSTTTALLLLAVALAGCSSLDAATTSDSAGDMAEAPYDGDDMSDEGAEEDSGEGSTNASVGGGLAGGGVDDVVTYGTGTAPAGRQLARTASVVLEVEDVEQAAHRVTAAAQRAGGFVSDATVRGGDFGSGYLTLRVPAAALDATIQDLATVGLRVVESSISTEDLTDQLTDLAARIDNLERLEAELQLLLSDVRDSDPNAVELLTVFERLNQVRGDIERLEAQRTGAQDRVTLATVHVELIPTATAPDPVEPEPDSTFGQAWQTTKDAFVAIGDALIWLGVTILPVALVLLGVPLLLLWLLVRLVRTRRDARLAAAPAPPMSPSTVDPAPTPKAQDSTPTPPDTPEA